MATETTQNLASGKMRCMHKECNREFDSPYEIFSGQLICPYCGRELGKKNFTVDANNDTLFRFAQIHFGDYLNRTYLATEEGEADEELSIKEIELRKKSLNSAIWHCREAARLGHPGACVLLGYFWECGYMERGSELDKYKMAFHYYNNVCETADVKVDAPEGVSTVGDYSKINPKEKMTKVRKGAAIYLLRMLSVAPPELDKMKRGHGESYSLDSNIKRLVAMGLVDSFPARKGHITSSTYNVDAMMRILKSVTKRGDHSPIFGYFIIPRSEFIARYQATDASSLKTFIHRNSGSIKILYAEPPESLTAKATFYRLDAKSLKIDTGNTDGDIYLYFRAEKPKLPKKLKISNGTVKEIFKELDKNDRLLAFINLENPVVEHVFYPEDIFFAVHEAKRKKKTKPLQALEAYIGDTESDEE